MFNSHSNLNKVLLLVLLVIIMFSVVWLSTGASKDDNPGIPSELETRQTHVLNWVTGCTGKEALLIPGKEDSAYYYVITKIGIFEIDQDSEPTLGDCDFIEDAFNGIKQVEN